MKTILSRLMYDRFTGFNLNLELITHINIHTIVRVTPPPFGTQYSGGFRRNAVRKGSVRSTQKFVRRHQFLL